MTCPKPSSATLAPPEGVPATAWRMCGSPIEKALLAELARCPKVTIVVDQATLGRLAAGRIAVVPQARVSGGHLADFLVVCGDARLVVECDGAQFHSRRDDAARDRVLDRVMQRAGYRVYRFTGEEIWRNAAACAESIVEDILRFAAEVA